ncbi:MAG: M23 family metallopeptidase [Clostridiales bacterium]|nr:M23 family metallopeptidase [Clostridiales bacterium]
MDKNHKQKVKDFFRKEGFYVVLFLCLCIVATVAAISYKISNNNIKSNEVEENNQTITQNSDDRSNVTSEMPNAERVENDKQTLNDQNEKTSSQSAAVSTNAKVTLTKPIEGSLSRGYTYPKPVKIDDDTQRTIKGIDIEGKIGTEVKAAGEGVIESIESNDVQDGVSIVIAHVNGIKTKYSNLDENVLVKKDQKVTSSTVIGKIGRSSKIYNTETFGEHLNLQVLDNKNEQIDPLKYFEYKNK